MKSEACVFKIQKQEKNETLKNNSMNKNQRYKTIEKT